MKMELFSYGLLLLPVNVSSFLPFFVIIIWHMHVQVTVFFHETDETPRNSSVFTSLSVTPP